MKAMFAGRKIGDDFYFTAGFDEGPAAGAEAGDESERAGCEQAQPDVE